jgi:NDP-sugar pyrophosphorylase family protein
MSLPTIGVLCGGRATRLAAVAGSLPKSLVPVAGEPFLAHQLRLLAAQGFRRAVLMIGYRGDQIREFVGDDRRFGIAVEYSEDGDAPLGTGGAVRRALPLLGDPFFVTYGDALLEFAPAEMWTRFVSSRAAAMMAVFRNRGQWDHSNVVFDGRLVRLHDKSTSEVSGMEWIDWGVSIFTATVIEPWPASTAFDLADVTKELALAGKLAGFEVSSRFHEIGTPEGLREADEYLRRRPA